MKLFTIIILVASILISFNIRISQAETTYLGEFCFVDSIILGPPPSVFMKIGILSYGAGHFVLNGSMLGNNEEPVSGAGIISGINFKASLVSSSVDSTASAFSAINVSLNPASQNSAPAIAEGSMTTMSFSFLPTIGNSIVTKHVYLIHCN